MALKALVYFLCALGISQKGLTALIQTKRVVMAAAGDQVCLSCQLMEPREVHQVTWQKILPDGERNVATFSKYRGERVNPGFHGKVEFKDAGLQSSSIVVLKVTEQDEGCYRCLFNTYRERALTEETCLKLYELHGPFIHIMESNSSDKAVVSCSATARPAPTVTLRVLNLKLKSSNDSHSNKNGTVTFSTTAELQRAVEVECEVQVPSVDPKRVFETVPEVKPALFSRQEGETGSSLPVIGVVLSVVVVVLLGVLGVVKRRQCYRYSETVKDPEGIKTPQKPPEIKETTPLLQRSGPRQRPSAVKERVNKSPQEAGCKAQQRLDFCNSPAPSMIK